MAYVSFDAMSNVASQATQNSDNVGFFSLRNDGDEAIVRFMHDDTSSFEILGTHQIQLNGKFRRVNCTRNPQDPISACPFCEKGDRLDYRFYIHLLQYTKNPDGTVSVEPKVWERSITYANKLKEYINNYGPLSDVICKIVRHGAAGDMRTEYEIIPNLSQQVYRPDIFVKQTGLFDNFKALGRIVLDRTADEINTFLATGNFPMRENQNSQQNSQTITTANPQWNNPQWNNPTTTTNPVPDWNTATTKDELPSWGVNISENKNGQEVQQNTQNFANNWTVTPSINRPVRY